MYKERADSELDPDKKTMMLNIVVSFVNVVMREL